MQIYRKWRAVKLLCLGSSTAMQACAMVGLEEEGKERKKEKDYTVRKWVLKQGGGERGMHGHGDWSGSWSICPSVSSFMKGYPWEAGSFVMLWIRDTALLTLMWSVALFCSYQSLSLSPLSSMIILFLQRLNAINYKYL